MRIALGRSPRVTLSGATGAVECVPASLPGPAPSQAPPLAPPAGLTEREREVLRLLARGLTDAQIAEALKVSIRTVQTHLRSIYRKLAGTTRTAAANHAHTYGLL